MSRSLIVLPDDSARPIVDAINGAAKSLRVKMFVFSDPQLLKSVLAARARGVKVRVMLNPARRSGEEDNEKSRKTLSAGGVDVRDSNPAYDVTHEKSMVVDEERAFVKSLNWQTKNLTETRDYAVVTSHAHEVNEVIECFEADWSRKDFKSRDDSHLIWCKGNGRDRIAAFIDAARHSLFIQNERYQDAIIIEHLVRAKMRGVKVHIMSRPPHTLKKEKLIEGVGGLRIMDDVGIKVRKMKHLTSCTARYCSRTVCALSWDPSISHPEVLTAVVSWQSRSRDDEVVSRLQKIVLHDWKRSHPLDLSDAGAARRP